MECGPGPASVSSTATVGAVVLWISTGYRRMALDMPRAWRGEVVVRVVGHDIQFGFGGFGGFGGRALW